MIPASRVHVKFRRLRVRFRAMRVIGLMSGTSADGIEWAHAEELAFATLLTEGTPIRAIANRRQGATGSG